MCSTCNISSADYRYNYYGQPNKKLFGPHMSNQQWNQQSSYAQNPYGQQGPYQTRVQPTPQQGFVGGQGYAQSQPAQQPAPTQYNSAYRGGTVPYGAVQTQYQQPVQAQTQPYGAFNQAQRFEAPPVQTPYQQPTQYGYGSQPYQQPSYEPQQQGYAPYQRQSPAPPQQQQPSPYSAMNLMNRNAPVQTQPFKQNYDQSQYNLGEILNTASNVTGRGYQSPQQPVQQRTRSPSPKKNFQRGRDSHRTRKRSLDRHHSPPRKVEKRVIKEAPPKEERRLPYQVKLNAGQWNVFERQFPEVKRRYANLHVVADFTKVINHWTRENVIELDHPITFECDNETGVMDPQVATEPASLFHGMKHNAKVMLISGVDWSEFTRSLHDHSDDPDKHLNHLLHFLIAKKDRSGLMCIGGSWSQKVDGGDPLTDETALLRTAMRCSKEFVGIDLSKCTKWVKFLEIWYHRPAEVIDNRNYPEMEERTIIYIPDIWNCLPNSEEFVEIWNKYQERLSKVLGADDKEKESVPSQPLLLATTQHEKLQQNVKCMPISLDGLLDYNLDDRLEKTFEVSLFAEAFSEYLQVRFGQQVFATIRDYEGLSREGLLKSDRSTDERDAKRVKLSEGSDANEGEDNHHNQYQLGDLDPELLAAFRYFDRNNAGFLRTEDLENILHGLGNALSRGYVQDLVAAACDSRESSSRVFYPSVIRAVTKAASSPRPTSTSPSPVTPSSLDRKLVNNVQQQATAVSIKTEPSPYNLSVPTTSNANLSTTPPLVPESPVQPVKSEEHDQVETHDELTMDEDNQ